jgi:pimeloyl-ACP methyl ester carboxylesterase
MIETFRVNVEQSVLDDLRERLRRTRWPDQIPGSGWEYGANLEYMKELIAYWQKEFDWRKQEREINKFPQFKAVIDGLGIHFVHVRGNGPNPLPLIITHGWPGSFLEMYKILALLTDPASSGGKAEDAFDVVVPSVPGYGFSDLPAKRGFTTFSAAELFIKLMEELGYHKFGAQGGDWGSSISTRMALVHPEKLLGLHLNYIPGSYRPYIGPETPALSAIEEKFVKGSERWLEEEGGYDHIQATYPQTAAFGLNDSPAGLAAWILEKLRSWSDSKGDVETRFSKDEILTHITLYWVTQTIYSSMRLYYEVARHAQLAFQKGEKVTVPTGMAHFAFEEPAAPREWVERGYNLQRWSYFPKGGHFAAWEEPELLAQDIREFFRPLR